jgi:prefoldin subunit 5
MLQESNNLEGNNMEPEEIKKKVSNSKDEIEKLSKVVNELQNECNHTDYIIKNVNESVTELRRVCKTCEKIIGYPNDKELKEAGY